MGFFVPVLTLFDTLRLEVYNARDFAYIAPSAVPSAMRGLMVSKYSLGEEGFRAFRNFGFKLVQNPDVVIRIGNRERSEMHGYYWANVPFDVKYYYFQYRKSRVFTYYGSVCGSLTRATISFVIDIFFTALTDGSDVESRKQAITNLLDAIIDSANATFESLGMRYPMTGADRKDINLVTIMPADYRDFIDLFEACDLCDVLEGINSLVEAFEWGTDADYWDRLNSIEFNAPNYLSWIEFFYQLWDVFAPVYQPCSEVGSSFIQVGSAVDNRPFGQVDASVAEYVLFTIWFVLRLRRLMVQLVDGMSGGGQDD